MGVLAGDYLLVDGVRWLMLDSGARCLLGISGQNPAGAGLPDAASLAAQTYVDPDKATIVIVGDADQFLEDLKLVRENVEVVPASKLDLASARLLKPLESDETADAE